MAVVAFAARHDQVETDVRIPLGMAQLSPDGLSEQWVLRFCGDRHWALIAEALGQHEAVFQAPDGRPVYAAFCATSLRMPPSGPLLGKTVHVRSTLYGLTDTRTGSRHRLSVDGTVIAELMMISTFVSHDKSGCNNRIHRNSVLGQMSLPPAGTELMALDGQARDTVRHLRGLDQTHAPEIHVERPVPSLDFNAVGLLYFPTFSRIAETAAWATGQAAPVRQRAVVHLGNINPGDTIRVFDHGAMQVLARQDGSPIAVIRTNPAVA
ncbi:Pnap_2097 family protein [Tropicibacter sp. S64]|uniref:Pnap_2097 family protein n=1 Tax=Tropicibacter sp. S64 TaxID=3415122 RepID=UPI003C7E8434